MVGLDPRLAELEHLGLARLAFIDRDDDEFLLPQLLDQVIARVGFKRPAVGFAGFVLDHIRKRRHRRFAPFYSSVVTARTSSSVVRPCSAFFKPSSRNVNIPCSLTA